MAIDQRTVDDITILDLTGPLIVERFGALKDRARQLAQQGRVKIVLNLAQVPYVDSIGVAEIIRVHMILCNRGGRLKLLNVPERVHHLLKITGLVSILELHDSEAAAIDGF